MSYQPIDRSAVLRAGNDVRGNVWDGTIMKVEMSAGAIGAGMFMIGFLMQSMVTAITGVVICAVIKGLLLLGDLGRPTKFLLLFTHPGKSWLAFGAYAFLLFCIFGAVYSLSAFFDGPTALTVIAGIAAFVSSIGLVTYEGHILKSSRAVPAWNNGALPAVFGASALSAGVAGLVFVDAIMGVALNMIVYVLGVVISTFLVYCLFGFEVSDDAAGAKAAFLVRVSLVLGAVAPLALYACGLAGMAFAPYLAFVAAVLQLVIVVTLRFGLLDAGAVPVRLI